MHLRLGIDRPPSGADLGRRAELAARDRAAGERLAFTVLEPGSDVCRGQIDTSGVDWPHRRAELGMWLAPQVRGRGLAPRALGLASRWLIEAAGFERVQVLTEPDNEAMLRTAAAAGYTREGTLAAYKRQRGSRGDWVILSLLPADLEPRQNPGPVADLEP